MRAQFVDRGEAHHALRASGPRSNRRNRANRPCHRQRPISAPSPPADPRGGAGPSLASVSVGGMRLLRRGGGISPGFARSAFGQASSNDAGGGSAVSTGGTVGGLGRRSDDNRSGGSGSPDRAWARSRSFRDVDENSKLRFGFGRRWRFGVQRFRNRVIAQDSLVLPRRRRAGAKAAVRWRKGSGTAGLLSGREAAIGGGGIPRRGSGKHRPSAASPRASGMPLPSRRAMFFNSRTAIQSASMIAPVQTPITPAMISVLPVLNSLIGIPKRSPAGPPKQGRSRRPT